MLPEFWSFNRARDESLIESEGFLWRGPFSWVGYESVTGLKEIPDTAGVYLFTYEYKDGFILRSVGVTNSMKRRFSEHTREYKAGNYTVLDVESAWNGERKEIWHGWGYARQHQKEFLRHRDFILRMVEKELRAYRLFIAEVTDIRKRERIEFSIVHKALGSKGPWADLIDGGMALRGRFNNEIPIKVVNACPYRIYGLPCEIEI